MSFGADALVLH